MTASNRSATMERLCRQKRKKVETYLVLSDAVRSLHGQMKVPNTECFTATAMDDVKIFIFTQLNMCDVRTEYAKVLPAPHITGIELSQEHVEKS